jgi:hypothetical protein
MLSILSNNWVIWPVGIALWLVLGFSEFGVIEAKALSAKAGNNQITLSYYIFYVTSKFPLAAIIGAFVTGGIMWGLAVHFWWHYCPPGSLSAG